MLEQDSKRYWEEQAAWFERKAIERSKENAWRAFQKACEHLAELDKAYCDEVGGEPKDAVEFQFEILRELEIPNNKKERH